MLKNFLKYAAGIDVAQNELVVALGRMHGDMANEIYAHKTFANTEKGFTALVEWVKKQAGETSHVHYVMEATGVYHEKAAWFLDELGLPVSIVLPNKMSNYVKTLDIKTSTDKTASEAIAMFGLERKLEIWKRPGDVYKKLRQLSRERNQLVEQKTLIKNQLHADEKEAGPNKASLARMKKHIVFLDKQLEEVNKEMMQLVKTDADVQKIVLIICSIPGVGFLTAATVLAETNGFDLVRNKRQLASYAGLDVEEKESGTSVKKKPKISKKGNKYLRKAMYMPALTALRTDERFKAVYTRLLQKHGIKMKAVVAIQRKLLEMIYTLFKNQTLYDKKYLQKTPNKSDQSNDTAA
jgi:transposase